MDYAETLNPVAKNNAAVLLGRMVANGITNPFTHAAILAVVSKESGFIPQSENLNYTAEGAAKNFGLPINVASKLAGKPEQLANTVYMAPHNSTLGNVSAGDGFKYRGRGYNQITGKSNYSKIGSQIGQDLVSNPDLLNDPAVASDAAIQFFKNGINALKSSGKLQPYNANDINDFKTPDTALSAIYNVNAGIGHSKAFIDADVTGGKAKASSRLDSLLGFVKGNINSAIQTAGNAIEVVKKNPLPTILITTALIVSLYFVLTSGSHKSVQTA